MKEDKHNKEDKLFELSMISVCKQMKRNGKIFGLGTEGEVLDLWKTVLLRMLETVLYI